MYKNTFNPCKKINRLGFTMIEVIVVLITIAIISTVVISRASFDNQYTLVSQVDLIKSHIRYAQTMAMNTDSPWGISFSGSSYFLFNGNSASDENKKILPGQNNEDVNPEVNLDNGTICFTKWGEPCTNPSTLTPSDADISFDISYGDAGTKTITIHKITGYIP